MKFTEVLKLTAVSCGGVAAAYMLTIPFRPGETEKPPIKNVTPTYILSVKNVPDTYKRALPLIQEHANSDKFYAYMASKRTYFAHFNGTVQEAITKFRNCLNEGGEIKLSFYNPTFPSKAIGGWNGKEITQNLKHNLKFEDRAGHLVHETSHKCGFSHKGNYRTKYDNMNSFPYAVGYDFADYIKENKL